MAELISLLDADPELGDLLAPDELERARAEALTRVRRLSTGAWRVEDAVESDVHHRGFMLADGLVSRDLDVLGKRCVELIGPGDVLRPWSWDEEARTSRPRWGMDRARADLSGRARPRSGRPDHAVAAAGSGAVQSRHPRGGRGETSTRRRAVAALPRSRGPSCYWGRCSSPRS